MKKTFWADFGKLSRKSAVAAASVCAILMSSPSVADTVVYVGELSAFFRFDPQIASLSRIDYYYADGYFAFPKFNRPEPLDEVHFEFISAASGTFDGVILAPPWIAAGMNANMGVRFTYSPLGVTPPVVREFPREVPPFNMSDTFTPTKLAVHFDFPTQSAADGPVIVPPSAHPLYQGTGDFTMPIHLDFVQEATVSDIGMVYQFTNTIGIAVRLTYVYNTRTISGTLVLEDIVTTAPAQNITFTFRPANGSPFDRVVSVGPNGAFSLAGIPAGSYEVHIKGAKWLAANENADVTNGNVNIGTVLLRTGDANNDNIVDVEDLNLFIQAFDADPTSPHWNGGWADFNCDDLVSVDDLNLLIRNFDAEGEG